MDTAITKLWKVWRSEFQEYKSYLQICPSMPLSRFFSRFKNLGYFSLVLTQNGQYELFSCIIWCSYTYIFYIFIYFYKRWKTSEKMTCLENTANEYINMNHHWLNKEQTMKTQWTTESFEKKLKFPITFCIDPLDIPCDLPMVPTVYQLLFFHKKNFHRLKLFCSKLTYKNYSCLIFHLRKAHSVPHCTSKGRHFSCCFFDKNALIF